MRSGAAAAGRRSAARWCSAKGCRRTSRSAGRRVDYLAGALDIVAHELTHGLTDYTSDLIYRNESGALNEAFSDILGTSVEFFYQTPGTGLRQADYLIGEDVFRPGGAPIDVRIPRRMAIPTTTRSGYTGTDDNGGVHTNSGIPNQAFYLAIEGGTNRTSGLGVTGRRRRQPRADRESLLPRVRLPAAGSNATFSTRARRDDPGRAGPLRREQRRRAGDHASLDRGGCQLMSGCRAPRDPDALDCPHLRRPPRRPRPGPRLRPVRRPRPRHGRRSRRRLGPPPGRPQRRSDRLPDLRRRGPVRARPSSAKRTASRCTASRRPGRRTTTSGTDSSSRSAAARRVWRNLFAGGTRTRTCTIPRAATSPAQVPHPFFFNQPRHDLRRVRRPLARRERRAHQRLLARAGRPSGRARRVRRPEHHLRLAPDGEGRRVHARRIRTTPRSSPRRLPRRPARPAFGAHGGASSAGW